LDSTAGNKVVTIAQRAAWDGLNIPWEKLKKKKKKKIPWDPMGFFCTNSKFNIFM
jgi:hypothetical protein